MSDFNAFFENDDPQEHEANDFVKSFADDFNEWLEGHEMTVHDGEKCNEERGNLLGYLLHRMGWTDLNEVLVVMVDRLAYYIEHHEHHGDQNGNGHASH